jgi:DNA-directed RNA polymerase specialized sigma24 family protein
VALNTVLTFKRKARSSAVPSEPIADHHAVSDSLAEDKVEALYQAIRSLGEVDRVMITMHLDGYDNDEIAEVSGLTRNHVGVKLFRIKELLAKKFN